MEESCSCDHHGHLTCIVGAVEPRVVFVVPGMITARETYNTISLFTPYPTGRYKKHGQTVV